MGLTSKVGPTVMGFEQSQLEAGNFEVEGGWLSPGKKGIGVMKI